MRPCSAITTQRFNSPCRSVVADSASQHSPSLTPPFSLVVRPPGEMFSGTNKGSPSQMSRRESSGMPLGCTCGPVRHNELKRRYALPPLTLLESHLDWDRCSVELPGHLIIPDLLNDAKQLMLCDLSSLWVPCRIVDAVGEERRGKATKTPAPFLNGDLAQSEASTKSSTRECSAKSTAMPASMDMITVNVEETSQLVVENPCDPSQFLTIAASAAYLPPTTKRIPDSVAKKVTVQLLVPGLHVEIRGLAPFAYWYPATVFRVFDSKDALDAEFRVFTGDVVHPVVTLLASDVQWRLRAQHRASVADLGGFIKRTFDWSNRLMSVLKSERLENYQRTLDGIKNKTQLLKAFFLPSTTANPPQIVLVGLDQDIAMAKTALIELLAPTLTPALSCSSSPHQERRQRRLKFLAGRREAFKNEVEEFSVDDAFIGVVIGRQGERLCRIAADFQVELRVFPEEHGIRRIRIYGRHPESVKNAKEALELVYQEIILSEGALVTVQQQIEHLKHLSYRAGLHFSWVNNKEGSLIIFGRRPALAAFRNRLALIFVLNSGKIQLDHYSAANKTPAVFPEPATLMVHKSRENGSRAQFI